MNYLRMSAVAFLLLCCCVVAFSQSSKTTYPNIGEPCPEFALADVKNRSGNTLQLSDLKGKFVIVDFWGTGCASCIQSFPKLNELQKEFGSSLQILLVGRDDKYIRPLYQRFKKKFALDLSEAYDTAVFKRFGIYGVPILYWIDDRQVVRAITSSPDELNRENLVKFLNGKPFPFTDMSVAGQRKRDNFYDFSKPLLIDGNGGNDTDFLYRSLLMKAKPNTMQCDPPFIAVGNTGKTPRGQFGLIHKNMVQGTLLSVSKLYEIAYGDTMPHYPILLGDGDIPIPTSYGRYWEKPLIEVKDSTPFVTDVKTLRNFYNYSLIVPSSKATTDYVRQIMQSDLKNYFGYDIVIETRKMPCWNLDIVNEQAKQRLLSKKKQSKYIYNASYLEFKNRPMAALIHALWGHCQDEPPFIDHTGIRENIDITLNVDLTNFRELKEALLQQGLRLTKGEKDMKVIVIRDK